MKERLGCKSRKVGTNPRPENIRRPFTVRAIAHWFVVIVAAAILPCCAPGGDGYTISKFQTNAGTEYRMTLHENGESRHFMTLIDSNGALALRPHPGVDSNGWGSSWYPQPFMAGAVLAHGRVDSVAALAAGIDVGLSGDVSAGANGTYGSWSLDMTFTYDAVAKAIAGEGVLSVALDGPVGAGTGDLNLYKIASNYLDNVPLLSGGIGDTGDMDYAAVDGIVFAFDWYPPVQPAHFPADLTDSLAIDVKGQYNEVDTAAQGHAPIAAAYKPSLKVILDTDVAVITFGGFYDTSVAQDFWEDNIGITPLVRVGTGGLNFEFDVHFESMALAGDGT